MLSSLLFRRLVLAAVGFSLVCFAPLRAQQDIHATIEQIHGLLKQAQSDDSGVAPSKDQRTHLLNQAANLLKQLPPGHYRGHRMEAEQLVAAALDQVTAGQADKAGETIRDADYEVRELE
jgi:hypothetical protein